MVAEVGLALAALVTLGLFLRSLYGLQNTPAGFDHRNVTVCRLFLVTNNYTARRSSSSRGGSASACSPHQG